MQSDPILTAACQELVTAHAAHTILLYGSRADGSAGADSDYDIAAFGPSEKEFRIARLSGSSYLDIFVYPQARLLLATAADLKLRGCRILLQRGTEAETFLRQLEEIFQRGPDPLPADENAVRRVWAHKMVARIKRQDAEGNYRRVWLLTSLLEDYFHIRGLWYQGPKKALLWLEQFDPPTNAAMRLALEPGAEEEKIRLLVQLVVGKPDSTDLPSSERAPL